MKNKMVMPDRDENKYLGLSHNQYGTVVSKHQCLSCGDEFTVCPALDVEKSKNWGGCQAESCDSYDPTRDADKLFDRNPELIVKL